MWRSPSAPGIAMPPAAGNRMARRLLIPRTAAAAGPRALGRLS
jgi:hypothetical protein